MDWTLTTTLRSRPKRCRLLELPPELRIAIFEYALASPKTVVTFRLDDYQRDSLQEAIQPPLTRVSSQVRFETLPIWYGSTTFVLHTEDAKGRDTQRWLVENEPHLGKLKLYRQATDDVWQVSDSWDWITVVRKPLGLEADAKEMILRVRETLNTDRGSLKTDARDWQHLLGNLREWYLLEGES
ncbi:hypothetical protein B0A55_01009 [Friedmanniomyces simplex]|uniref:Uncharacterized protein n=1 Tax=Friedmanniomyces simplex TaxID=329884 RepID=A0A4U0Y3K7_9PEZI|nr:hypothetical protein B0A55_01009 [Friedmanniomyces simplex]